MSLQFDEGTYTVTRRTDSIQLLAKEFALFIFYMKTRKRHLLAASCWTAYGRWSTRLNEPWMTMCIGCARS